MKKLLLALALSPLILSAAEPAVPAAKTKNWYDGLSLSPFGALNHPDFGRPVWGAGLDVGFDFNKIVSLHVANLVYDLPATKPAGSETRSSSRPDQGWKEGPAVDETDVLLESTLWGAGKKTGPRLYFLGGGSGSWTDEILGLSAGLGVDWRFTEHASIGIDGRVRAWFKEREKDLPVRLRLRWDF